MKQIAATDVLGVGLPGEPDTEKLFLGAIMRNPEEAPLFLSWIADDDFMVEDHRQICSAIRTVTEAGGNPDRVAVYHELQKRPHARSITLTYLTSLDDGLPEIYGLEGYAEILRGLALRRRLVLAGHAIEEAALLDNTTPPHEMVEQAERRITSLDGGSSSRAHLRSAGDWFADCGMEKILMPTANGEPGIPIPWPSVASLLPSLRAGQLVVAAARPAIGKTAFAAQIGAHAAERGIGVALFSLEMSAAEILQRLACGRAGIDSHLARQGRLTLLERSELQGAASALAELPLYIDDTTGVTVGAVSAAVRALHARQKVGLVIVDYLHLMSSPGKRENRNVEVSEISRGLKRLARELKIPVLACCQLNRDCEKEGRRPMLADLRDSGSIEQDADVVLFLHQPKPDVEKPVVETEILISKHRGGRVGKRRLSFIRTLTLFRELTHERTPTLKTVNGMNE